MASSGMNSDANPILMLVWTFALMSLFAVGGANSAIPEVHRVAVDVRHWITDQQFADVFGAGSPSFTAVSAALAFSTRLNPLWILLAGGCLGFAGVI
jgi:chromate transport protein ChrA